VLSRRFDVGKCKIAVCVRDVVDLVKPRKGVANVRCVNQRFLTLLGKRKHRIRKTVAFTARKFAVGGVRFEGNHEPDIPEIVRRQTRI
jgi:hypothetical protein